MRTHWTELVVTDADGETVGTLENVVETIAANLDNSEFTRLR